MFKEYSLQPSLVKHALLKMYHAETLPYAGQGQPRSTHNASTVKKMCLVKHVTVEHFVVSSHAHVACSKEARPNADDM